MYTLYFTYVLYIFFTTGYLAVHTSVQLPVLPVPKGASAVSAAAAGIRPCCPFVCIIYGSVIMIRHLSSCLPCRLAELFVFFFGIFFTAFLAVVVFLSVSLLIFIRLARPLQAAYAAHE